MRVVFMGTPEFAATSLEALLDTGHEVVGVWTRMDKPHGRGGKMDASPVKQMALGRGIPLFQAPTLRKPESAPEMAALKPDAICVAAYGLILPPAVLEIPRLGCVNVHASLLPRYRGAAPIHRAILAGDRETGITTMMMDTGLDTGDILLVERTPLGNDETYGEVQSRLAEMGGRLLVRTLEQLERGDCPRTAQDSSQATQAPPVRKEECQIDWRDRAMTIHDLVRGTNPRPGAYTFRAGDLLRVHRTAFTQALEPGSLPPGSAFQLPGRKGLAVVCGDGALELREVQPSGKKAMASRDYLLGRPLRPGERFGLMPEPGSVSIS